MSKTKLSLDEIQRQAYLRDPVSANKYLRSLRGMSKKYRRSVKITHAFFANGLTCKELAQKFGLCQETIRGDIHMGLMIYWHRAQEIYPDLNAEYKVEFARLFGE